MKRRLLIAAWIAGATVPALLATVFIAGCCVLPFHGVVHRLMPVCDMAISVLRGDAEERDAAPVPEKQAPAKRIVTQLPRTFHLGAQTVASRAVTPTPITSYRSFITLGAVRCDRDVGLHVFVATFLI